jgi:hypothetical protein
MGLAWGALLVAAAELGTDAVAALMAPVAVIASVSGVREVTGAGRSGGRARNRPRSKGGGRGRRSAPRRRPALRRSQAIAVTSSILLPLAALGGPIVAAVFGGLVAAGAVAVLLARSERGFPYAVLFASLGPAVAAASVVLARGQGLSGALTLLAAVCLYDMASFLTGTGPRGGPVGAIVGVVTVGVLAVFVAAVVVPPFSGHSPWILLGLVAALAPVGVFAFGRIGPERRLPALRRLDSLILAGPAWVIAAGLMLHQ